MTSPNLMLTVRVVVAYFFVLQVSTSHSVYPRIVNGVDTFKGQFPFMASIQLGISRSHFKHICSGIIYNTYWIYTVATCAQSATGEHGARIKVGMFYTDKDDFDTYTYDIKYKVIHEQYNGSLYYDVALLGTMNEIQLGQYVQLANLYLQPEFMMDEFVMVGWGRTSAGSKGKVPSVLQAAAVQLLDYSICSYFLSNYNLQSQSQYSIVCTNKPTQAVAACMEDTGGALVYYTDCGSVVVGLISAISPVCDLIGVPTISTLVSYHKNWADNKMALYPLISSV